MRNACRFFVGKPERIDHWGDPGIGGTIILRWIFRKWDGVYGLDRADSG
jgi:hypothetical protein